jgi:DNA-binding PadR family transcriptional regulator
MREDKIREIGEPREKSAIMSHWERDFRRGLLQLMILMLIRLRTEEAHGYGLIKLIRETGVQLKAGTIYPLLKRMEKDGLIESFLADDADQPGQARRIYIITSDGEEMIDQMIETYHSYDNYIKKWYQEISDFKVRRRSEK